MLLIFAKMLPFLLWNIFVEMTKEFTLNVKILLKYSLVSKIFQIFRTPEIYLDNRPNPKHKLTGIYRDMTKYLRSKKRPCIKADFHEAKSSANSRRKKFLIFWLAYNVWRHFSTRKNRNDSTFSSRNILPHFACKIKTNKSAHAQ